MKRYLIPSQGTENPFFVKTWVVGVAVGVTRALKGAETLGLCLISQSRGYTGTPKTP